MPAGRSTHWWGGRVKSGSAARWRTGKKLRRTHFAILEGLESRIAPAVYKVIGTGDDTNSTPSSGAGTVASPFLMPSLRGAVIAANAHSGSTIEVPAGTYQLTIAPVGLDASHAYTSATGELDVNVAMTIEGVDGGGNPLTDPTQVIVEAGTTATNGISQIFNVNPAFTAGYAASFSGMTLRFGKNVNIDDTFATNGGGALGFSGGSDGAGSLTLTDLVVTQNSTTNGNGGGIALYQGGTVHITDSTISNNTAKGNVSVQNGVSGGGLWQDATNTQSFTLTMTNTTVSGNNATSQPTSSGGGIFISGTTGSPPGTISTVIHGGTISNNTATDLGGGVNIAFGSLTIDQGTTISGNTLSGANSQGGGVFYDSSVGSATLTGLTITNNSAGIGGGGIFDALGPLTVSTSRIVGNTSTTGGSAIDRGISTPPVMTAINNWWGVNTPPASFFGTVPTASHSPNLVMLFTAGKTTFHPGDSTTLTASITTNSSAQTGFSIPNGAPVTFSVPAALGMLTVTSTTLTSSTATSSFTAGTTGGTGNLSSTIDNQTLTVQVTVIPQADLAVSKTGPSTVFAGNQVTYTVTLTNSGPSAAQNAGLADTLPTGETFVSQSQSSGPSFTLNHTTTSVNDTLASFASGQSAVFVIVAQVGSGVAKSSVLVNSATGSSATQDPVPGNNTSTSSTTVDTSADLSLTKSAPSTVFAGNQITYTLTLTNTGPSDAQSVSLQDTLPTGTSFSSQSQSSGPTFSLASTSGSVTDTIAALVAGQSAVFLVVAQVPANLSLPATLINSATATTSTTDPVSGNNTSSASTTVQASADLVVTKSAPASVLAGNSLTYSVTVTNNGPSDAQAVSLTDTLPVGETFATQSQASGPTFVLSNSGNAITDTITTLAAGASASFTFVANVSASTASTNVLSNTASATATTPDPTPANSSSTAATTVNTSADLSVTKSGPATVNAGTALTYTVTVSNAGPSDAQGVSLTDTLPVGETFSTQSQTSGPTFVLGNTGNAITDTITTLAAGASASFTFVANVSGSLANNSTLTNTANIGSSTTDPTSGNNASSATTTVKSVTDLSVTKSGPANATAGTKLTYTLTLTNQGPNDAALVVLSDVLPASETFVSQAQSSGPSFTLSNTGNNVNDTIALLTNGSSAVFTIVATVNANNANNATITNTATVSAASGDPVPANNSSSVTTTVQTQADVSVSKSGPSTIFAGANLTYAVTVTNTGPSDAQSVVLADTLPAGETFVAQTQGGGATFTLSNVGSAISDSIATLASGASQTFVITAHVASSQALNSTLVNTASETSTTTDPTSANNSSSATTTVQAQADVSVSKSGPSTVVAGTNVTYTVTVANAGPSDAQSVVLADTLPAGETFVAQTQGGGATFTLSNVGSAISDSIATLASGASQTFVITAHVASSQALNSTLVNTASETSSTTDPTSANNSSSVTTTVQTQADVSVSKSGPSTIFAGANLTYTVTVTNTGPSDAQLVVLSDTLPSGETFVAQTQGGGASFTLSNVGSAISDSIATLVSGASQTFVITAHVASSQALNSTLVNTASETSTTTDPTSANNSSSVTTTVQTQADVSVSKSGPTTVVAGTNLTYTVTVTNAGPSDAQTVVLADTLPSGETFVAQTQGGGATFTLSNVGSAISDSIATLASGASQTFVITAHVASSQALNSTLVNTASETSTTTDPTSANNSSSATTTVQAQADVSVSKSGPSTVVAGTNVTYTVTVANAGPSDAQSVVLADTLPAGETFVAQTQGGGATFTLSNVGSAISDSIATLASGASQTFVITAHVASSQALNSTLVNTASETSTTTDPTSANNSSSVTTTVQTQADVSVSKSGPTTVVAGTDITYTVTVSNPGPSDAQSVVLADILPPGETFATQTQGGGPTFSLSNTGNSISDSIATLPAGTTQTLVITALVSPSQAQSSTLVNAASGSASTTDPTPVNNISSVTTTVLAQADLAMAKSGPTDAVAGNNITYSLTITNAGPSDAQSVNLADTLPLATTFVSMSQTSGPLLGGTLPVGQTETFVLVAHVLVTTANGTVITNSATVTSTTTDPNPANNTSTATTTVHNQADLSVTKTGPSVLVEDTNATYTVTVQNLGPTDALSVALTDTLPTGTTFVAQSEVSGPSFTLANTGNQINDTIGQFANGATAIFSIVIHVAPNQTSGSTINNTATISSITFDPVLRNNTSTTSATVLPAGLIPDPVSPGRTALYISGTTGTDQIILSPGGTSGGVKVTINGVAYGPFFPTSVDIFISGETGYNQVLLSGSLNVTAKIFAVNSTIAVTKVGVPGAGTTVITGGPLPTPTATRPLQPASLTISGRTASALRTSGLSTILGYKAEFGPKVPSHWHARVHPRVR